MTTSAPGSTIGSRYSDRYTTYLHQDEYVYSWTIHSFDQWLAEIGNQVQYSSPFPEEPSSAYRWKLQFHPKVQEGGNTFCGVHLQLQSAPKAVNAKFEISISEGKGRHIKASTGQALFNAKSDPCWGWPNFVSPQTLLQKLKNDILVISCKIEVTVGIVNEGKAVKPAVEVSTGKDLGNDLATLLAGDKFGDTTITVGKKKFLVYKGILAARSSVFAAMFEHNMVENSQNNVTIIDIQSDVFGQLLRYIYTDKVENLNAFAHQLFAAADKYCILSLKALCQQFILAKLSTRNAAKTLLLADKHQEAEMKARVLQFLSSRACRGVTNTAGWKSMALTHPHLVSEVLEANISKKISP